MIVKSGSVWNGLFVTVDATGALATPSAGPTGKLYVDGVANSTTVTITGSNPYKFSVTLPSLTAGQHVDMYITATISSIATAGIVASAQADTVLLSDGVTLADDAITAAKFDESTAFPLKAADTGSTQVARRGSENETLSTLSNTLNNISYDIYNLPTAVWAFTNRTLSSFGTLVSNIWTHATRTLSAFGFTVATNSDANVTAIKVKTDNLPASPAPAGEYDTELAAIQADLDNPNQYKADVSALAKTTHVQEVEDKVDAVKLKTDNIPANPAIAGEYTASLAAIQADLDNPEQYQADVSGIPDAILAKVIVGTLTVEQVLKVLAAVETGITTGGGTDTITYTGKDGTEIRLTGVDENGNRTAVIVTPGA